MDFEFIKKLAVPKKTKILMLVLDGLGGLGAEPDGPTELESAKTPNLDQLASGGICGLHEPVGPGITPGSGLGHLALFGYNPMRYHAGRGVLAALGSGFDLQPGDIAARGNFCTVDGKGVVRDRRAGRISSEENKKRCELLREIDLGNEVELFVETVSKRASFSPGASGKKLAARGCRHRSTGNGKGTGAAECARSRGGQER